MFSGITNWNNCLKLRNSSKFAKFLDYFSLRFFSRFWYFSLFFFNPSSPRGNYGNVTPYSSNCLDCWQNPVLGLFKWNLCYSVWHVFICCSQSTNACFLLFSFCFAFVFWFGFARFWRRGAVRSSYWCSLNCFDCGVFRWDKRKQLSQLYVLCRRWSCLMNAKSN